jgi:putative endonuclease
MKTILVDAVNTLVIKDEGIYKPIFDLLETYPNEKIILTNANDEQLETFNFLNWPYKFFTLKHNPDKVEPEYFHKMLRLLDLKKEDVIYFEHSPKAVESARSVGIVTYHYDYQKKDVKALKSFLDDNLSVFTTYMLECADKTLYVGSTNNMAKRLHEHNNSKNGAHYTKIRRPVKLVYSEESETLKEARARELKLKALSRKEKLALVTKQS